MQDFETKRKNLFNLLDIEEKKLKGSVLEQQSYSEDDSKTKKPNRKRSASNDNSVERLIGKESIFKKPELPIQRCLKPRIMPDHKVNPHKWTKYSLEDADISDQTNTSAAYAFLEQIEKRKEMEDNKLHEDENDEDKYVPDEKTESNKIVFNKTASLKRTIRKPENELDDVETQTPKFKSSTVVMPEYVVGQKSGKEKRKRIEKKNLRPKAENSKELKLSHLLEYKDEEDDEED